MLANNGISIKPIHPKIPIILSLILETKSGEKRGAVASQNSLVLTAPKAENRGELTTLPTLALSYNHSTSNITKIL
jgi:hypothetical protein